MFNSCTTCRNPTKQEVIVPCDRDAVEVQGGTAHQCPQKRLKTKTPRVGEVKGLPFDKRLPRRKKGVHDGS